LSCEQTGVNPLKRFLIQNYFDIQNYFSIYATEYI